MAELLGLRRTLSDTPENGRIMADTQKKELRTMRYEDMTFEEQQAEKRRRQEEADARYERRQAFLTELLGPPGVARFAPPPVRDFDAQLGEHAAQLAKLTRLTLNYALNDDGDLQTQMNAASAVTRLIQTNVAIARVLLAKSKTVQGVPADKEPQAVVSQG
ncbi:MAG: hypothetical protein JSR60_02275 [Proteobacteria bacterium]|nr:hypothetical protein [Pseudomonadota bacterium]